MIDIKSLTSNDVIKVGTEEEYAILCKMLDEAGYKWCNHKRYTLQETSYNTVKNKYINPRSGNHGEVTYSKPPYVQYSLADFLPSPSSSNSFTTLFPFNLTS